ncbi:MAG: response regulator [Pirellulaceae bacterium]
MADGTDKILICLHDPLLTNITEYRLQLLGYDVVSNRNAMQLLDEITQQQPRLLILGSDISESDTTQVVTDIRIRMSAADLAIMVLSSNSSLDSVRQVFLAGADDYLFIPYDPAVLQDKVETLLAPDRVIAVRTRSRDDRRQNRRVTDRRQLDRRHGDRRTAETAKKRTTIGLWKRS